MSNNRLVLTGFEELKQQLRNLPTHLAEEAAGIVVAHAQTAAGNIRAAYPEGPTGNLKRGVKVDQVEVGGRTNAGARARVRSTARHAFIYENGTQARHTDEGWNRGAMPPGNVFIPAVVRERRAMVNDLIAMVQREGLTVTGNG